MAFFRLLKGASTVDLPIEEGTLRRRNARSGAKESAGGRMILDRSRPAETYTFDTCILTVAEFADLMGTLANDELGLQYGHVGGSFEGAPSAPNFQVMVLVNNWTFLTDSYVRVSLEVAELSA